MFKNWDLDHPMTRRDYMNLGLYTLVITAVMEVGIYVWYKYQMNEIERSYSQTVMFTPIYNANKTDEEDEDEEDYGL